MGHFTEFTIEEASLEWLKDMGYTIVLAIKSPGSKYDSAPDGWTVAAEIDEGRGPHEGSG
jgi:hypothetical protein